MNRLDLRSSVTGDRSSSHALHARRSRHGRARSHALGAAACAAMLAGTAMSVPPLVSVIKWGGADGNWDDATKWMGGAIPKVNDIARLDTSVCTLKAGVDATCTLLQVGSEANAGKFVIAGGTLSMNAGGSMKVGAKGETGRVEMSGGQVDPLKLYIGSDGDGKFTQSGGSVGTAEKPLGTVTIGAGPGGKGNYGLSAGKLFTKLLSIGDEGVGVFELSGTGELTTKPPLAGGISIGSKKWSDGLLKVTGGKMKTEGSFSIGAEGVGALLVTAGDDHEIKGDVKLGIDGGVGQVVITGGKVAVTGDMNISVTDAKKKSLLGVKGNGNADGPIRLKVTGVLKTATDGNAVIDLQDKARVQCMKNLVPLALIEGNGKIEPIGAPLLGGEPFFSGGKDCTLAPGHRVDDDLYGVLEIGGDTELDHGFLVIDLGGDEPGVSHDQLRFDGALVLDGTVLNVIARPELDTASLPVGAFFRIIEADMIIGDFGAIQIPPTGNPDTQFALVPTPLNDALDLVVVPADAD
ncbi:MAG: hypothetical protein U0575_06990 [Phycisphaerales bacterium]